MKSLSAEVQSQQRMNKALRVGRVPVIVIKTRNALHDAGLHDHFVALKKRLAQSRQPRPQKTAERRLAYLLTMACLAAGFFKRRSGFL